MNKRTLTALKKSIEHWEENAAAITPSEAAFGAGTCALCGLFINNGCRGCPVAAKTGSGYCDDTPYISAHDAHLDWLLGEGSRKTYAAAAKAELKFLRSLLPQAAE